MRDRLAMFRPEAWVEKGGGPLFEQLYRRIAALIAEGALAKDARLPTERELSMIGGVSRVTVRNALAELVKDGLLEQRRGAGTFVRTRPQPNEHSLTRLLSFSEYMRQRGIVPSSRILRRGIFLPNPDEQFALGLLSSDRVTRVDRLRYADDMPHALEWSSLPQDVLPDPEQVETSLYDVLLALGRAPSRAVQRITAVNIPTAEGRLMGLDEGAVVLRIDRTAYLPSGRPIEFTRGYYRSDTYAFVAELNAEQT